MYKVNGLMLIGSIARGDAYPESDLDLYVLLVKGTKEGFSCRNERRYFN